MAEPRKIWLTRPTPDSVALAELLTPLPTLVAPLMSIEPCDATAEHEPEAILLTSRHAVPFLKAHAAEWGHLRVFTVGESTAQAARAIGYGNLHIGDGDALALLPALSQLPRGTRLLHPGGEERSVELGPLLAPSGIEVESLVTYRAIAMDALAENAVQALRQEAIRAVVFYSPRSARLAHALMEQAGLLEKARSIDAYCLSLAVAAEAGITPWAKLHACPVPTQKAMLELLLSHHDAMVL